MKTIHYGGLECGLGNNGSGEGFYQVKHGQDWINLNSWLDEGILHGIQDYA